MSAFSESTDLNSRANESTPAFLLLPHKVTGFVVPLWVQSHD